MFLTNDMPILARDVSGRATAYQTKDCGLLCCACVHENLARILSCDDDCPDDDQWNVVGACPAPSYTICDNCYKEFL